MDYRTIHIMGEGELLPLIYSVMTLPRHKCVRMILLLMILFSLSALMLDTYQIIRFWSEYYFFQYGSFYLITITMIAGELMWFATYFSYEHHLQVFKSQFYWSLRMADHRTQKKILRECTFWELIGILIVILAMVLSIAFISFWMKNSSRYSAWSAFANEHLPEFALALDVVGVVVTILGAFTMTTMMWFPFYVIVHLRFQLLILCTYVKNLSGGCANKDLKLLLNDIKHQRSITKRLKFCIKRHQKILSHHTTLKKIDQTFHINSILIISGFLLGYFSIFTWFSPDFPPLVSILTFMIYLFTMMIFSVVSQMLEDTSEYLAITIYYSNWSTWNKGNLKIFQIFHLNTATRILQVPSISFIRVNNSFMKSVSRAMYSMANLLYTSTK